MLNRAANSLQKTPGEQSPWENTWDVDRYPGLRLALLFCGIALPVCIAAWRVAQVQCTLAEAYTAELRRTSEKIESIPSHNGRILGADGQVLAQDEEFFTLHAHYRWIEDPPNPYWLKQYVRLRLPREARKDSARIEAETETVLGLRKALWEDLATLSGIPLAELNQTRRTIQARVERIQKSVAEQRESRQVERDRAEGVPVEKGTWWQRTWQSVVAAVTTSPRREPTEPPVLQDELAYHLLAKGISLKVRGRIETHPEIYPGLRIEVATRRIYPAESLAAHVIGNRVQLDEDKLRERRQRLPAGDPLDYRVGDWIGETGIERYYDRVLRGIRGERRLTLNRHGEVLRTEVLRHPRVGGDIELSLNLALQRQAEKMLDAALSGPAGTGQENPSAKPIPQGGVILVMDVRNGEVVAAACAPRFDLNLLAGADRSGWSRIAADKRRPFFNRLTQMALPPGSVFKTLTAVALLQEGAIAPRHQIFCQGYLDHPGQHRCYKFTHTGFGHDKVDLTAAIAESCNVFFFTAAKRLGAIPLCDWAQRFGFGQATGIDLPGEAGGNLPIPEESLAPNRVARRSIDTLGLAIGQANLTVTPLQVVRMMAAVANGGKLLTPRLVAGTGAEPTAGMEEQGTGTARVLTTAESNLIPDLTPATLAELREGLRQVVSRPGGTGYKTIRLKQVAIAGKTGTAEVTGRDDHAWFAGYVPVDRPRYAFVVVLEHAGSGGAAAGPVARTLVEAMLHEGLLGQRQLSLAK